MNPKTITLVTLIVIGTYAAFVHMDKLKLLGKGFMHSLKSMTKRKEQTKTKGNTSPKGKFPCYRCNKIFDSPQGRHIHDCKYVRPDLNKQKEVKKYGIRT